MTFVVKHKDSGAETCFDTQEQVDYFFSLGASPSHYEVIVPAADPVAPPVVEEASQEVANG